MKFKIEDLQSIFHKTFREEYQTRLEFGHHEPFYQAAPEKGLENIIFSREDFFASGLHEIAHWCLAGDKRRKLDDYGYWYSPDDRDKEKQALFEKVEVKPQAIEKAFCIACTYPFKPSTDNHSLKDHDPSQFIFNINKQFKAYSRTKFPRRAELFIEALKQFYQK
ncbi:conserved hypothetical protein [Halobacteriovorax marinus SJ]|uniref:Elongation factor P hydroxylase n=1 Tax=Halobacteriovorax marinus (strain ATCC BAA-682 / DSM 15412 / SJ) TaxID=862908 RepID=E1WZH0_HALMS|nr:elongation factor P hydroxylase [Halobacteriovorax marinus]CBW27859.1 conserved hypothetical protein [Halobacteriovorax marinus SJ]